MISVSKEYEVLFVTSELQPVYAKHAARIWMHLPYEIMQQVLMNPGPTTQIGDLFLLRPMCQH